MLDPAEKDKAGLPLTARAVSLLSVLSSHYDILSSCLVFGNGWYVVVTSGVHNTPSACCVQVQLTCNPPPTWLCETES